MALLLIGGIIWKMGEAHSVRHLGYRRSLRILEQAGKNSFSLFILHFLIYIQILPFVATRIQLMTPAGAVLFLPLSLLGIMALGGVCDRLQLNRFWTVGLLTFSKRWPISTSVFLITAEKPVYLFRVAGPQLAASAPGSVDHRKPKE
jgi:peptidoglycan/LPS O-acetylase OafA/YrhL